MSSRTTIIAIGVLMALCLSACGSSSSSKSSSTPAVAPSSSISSSAAAPKGAAIRVGSICSCSGVQAGSLGEANKVAQAWADSVNASGGINGHPVKLYAEDDGGNPATSLQDVKQLVQQDHVMAIVSDVSLADASFASYVEQQNVPVIGGLATESTFLSNPDFFSSGTTAAIQTFGVLALGKAAGVTDVGTEYCAESPTCKQLVPLATGEAKILGEKVIPAEISATAPSYAAPCLAAKGAGAKAVYVIDTATVVQRFLDGCAQEGYKPVVLGAESSTANTWLSDPNLNGAVLDGSQANAFDTSTPAVARFQSALKTYIPGLVGSSQFSAIDMYPWAAGQLFQAAATAGHIGPTSTGADVKKGLYALKNETLDGLAPPLNFTPGKPSSTPCYFTVKISHGTYASLNGDKATCLPSSEASELATALG